VAVQEILAGGGDHAAIWDVNIDDEYHEEKSAPASGSGVRQASQIPVPRPAGA
jgi:hypothetical protein